ncbi:nicotinamide riboside transporter PnuC [Kingella negevensis]|uniref:nicotinamide riboside transporter PnuC n=1 Tax=Kingella negevensis TaxID=1522312 RepID=UPI003CC91D7B
MADSVFGGEMNTVLYVYLPSQFIGYFVWKENMQKDGGSDVVKAKKLSAKGWGILLVTLAVSTFVFVQALRAAGGSSTGLDSMTTMITVAEQLLIILHYREQWLLWIALNILSIILWAENSAMYLMYGAYLLNSSYGFYNWTKLQQNAA